MRADEAAAKAAEEAAEERMQEADASRRLAILRGEEPPPLLLEDGNVIDPAAGPVPKGTRESVLGGGKERTKRKRHGEDDTDFEMRVAMERAAEMKSNRQLRVVDESELPEQRLFLGPDGHKDLFKPSAPDKKLDPRALKARERPADPDCKAAINLKDDEASWLVSFGKPGGDPERPGRDVWGNEDPRRKERDAARLDKDDPLATMKSGAAKVRELGKERQREAEERERELRMLRKEEKRREKRRKREGRGRDEVDDLEEFSLDGPPAAGQSESRRHRSRHRSEEKRGDEKHKHSDEGRRHKSSRGDHDRHGHRHRHGHDRREEGVRSS